ncbi:MAG: hypothetical protein IPG89_05820 [Bacteroidetes bacterium]|nr:hypothetical protein [Bacteroidota bacterium]
MESKEQKPIKILLTVKYSSVDPTIGNGSNDFVNLQELKKWLDKHPRLAEELGYTKQKRVG